MATGLVRQLRDSDILNAQGLQDCVLAFRKLNGRSNAHFANEVFNFIADQISCSALAMDVSDFFGNLNHDLLKTAWRKMLNLARLPSDHFAVFQAITRYCLVGRTALFNAVHVPLNDPRLQGPHRLPLLGRESGNLTPDNTNRLCPPHRFREWVRKEGLLQINHTGNRLHTVLAVTLTTIRLSQ